MTPIAPIALSRLCLKWFPVILIIGVTAHYFMFISQLAVDIPHEDDIYDVLNFMIQAVSAESWRESLVSFFTSFNGHGTTASRLVYFTVYSLQGSVDFRTLNFFANLALPLLLFLLCLPLRHHRYCWLILLASALVLLQPRAHMLILWPMSAIAYFYVLFYGFCCVYCLHRVNRVRFVLAIVFGLLANYSLASGQLIWLIGLIGLLHQKLVHKRSINLYILAWSIAGFISLAVFHLVPAAPTVDFALPKGHLVGAPLLDLLVHRFQFFVALLGSAVTSENLVAAYSVGVFSLLAIAFIILRSYRGSDIRLELCCVYIVLTIAAISWGRAEMAVIDYALASRFSFPSILLLSTLWVLIAVKVRRLGLPLVIGAVLAAGVYSISSYCIYSGLLQADINKRIVNYNGFRYPAIGRTRQETVALVKRAKSLGIYRGPQRPLEQRDATPGLIGAQQCEKAQALWRMNCNR